MGLYSDLHDEQSNDDLSDQGDATVSEQSISDTLVLMDQDVQSRLLMYKTLCADLLTEIQARLLQSLQLHSNQPVSQLQSLIDADPYVNQSFEQWNDQTINQAIHQSIRTDWVSACDSETTSQTIDRYLRLHQSISFLRYILKMINALSNQSNSQSSDDAMIKQIEGAMEAMGIQAQ